MPEPSIPEPPEPPEKDELVGEFASMLVAQTLRIPGIPGTRAQPVPLDLTHVTNREGTELQLTTRARFPYDFEEPRFMITSFSLLRLTTSRRMRGTPRLVLDWLCLHIQTENLVIDLTHQRIATDLGVARPNITTALGLLEREGILLRGSGSIMLNPRYVFKGTSTTQRRAAQDWDQRWAEHQRALMLKQA